MSITVASDGSRRPDCPGFDVASTVDRLSALRPAPIGPGSTGAEPPWVALPVTSTGSDLAVEVESLTMRYGDLVAVDEVSFAARLGEVTAVLGPNGAGKTTTIEACEGYRRPTAGTVRVLGLDPARQQRAAQRRTSA